MGYLYLFCAIISTSFGQLLLKKYNCALYKKIYSYDLIIAICLICSVPVFIFLSLKYLSFTIVFLSDALSIVLIVVISGIFLKENISLKKLLGVIFIIIGIFLLNGKIV